jgi:hypothetical protein
MRETTKIDEIQVYVLYRDNIMEKTKSEFQELS